jgi:AraC-like DNA-binding protein
VKKHQLFATDPVDIPKINSIGFSDDPEITHFGPSVRNQYIIHYVLSGKGYFNGREVRSGEGFLITPGMHEEYHPDKATPWSFVWVTSEDKAMIPIFERHRASEETGIFKIKDPYGILAAAEELRSVWDGRSSSTELCEMFLRCYNSAIMKESLGERSAKRTYFEFTVNYVKTNIHLPLRVESICNAIGITQPYLYKIFKQEVGVSPKQYISNCKLLYAKKLICETDLSISEISESVGFSSVLDFSKFFSKQTKSSPTAYRSHQGKIT